MKGLGTIIFRAAGPQDIPALALLVNSGYRGDVSREGWTTEADLLDGQRTDEGRLGEILERPDVRIEVAFDGPALIACMELRRESPESCYLGMLTVAPARQARGTGSALLSHAENLAQGWGCRRIRMTVVHLRPELLAYYERRGYRRTGGSEPFPAGDRRFGIPKRNDLRLVELVKTLP